MSFHKRKFTSLSADYCRRKGLGKDTFFYWKKTLFGNFSILTPPFQYSYFNIGVH